MKVSVLQIRKLSSGSPPTHSSRASIQSHLVVRNLFVRENLLFRNQGLRAQRPHTKSLAIMKYIVKDTV